MESVRNVQLISTDAPNYQEYVRYVSTLNRLRVKSTFINQPTIDLTQQISHKAEWLVRQWLEHSSIVQPNRVISYEKYQHNRQRYSRCYQETDAIFQDENSGSWQIAEVKLSRNPDAVRKAVSQLTRSMTILQTTGLRIQPIVIWLTLCPSCIPCNFQPVPFCTDYRQLTNRFYGKSQIPVVSITPESLFQWGIIEGLCTQTDLDQVVAARQAAQGMGQHTAPETTWTSFYQSNNLLAARLAVALKVSSTMQLSDVS